MSIAERPASLIGPEAFEQLQRLLAGQDEGTCFGEPALERLASVLRGGRRASWRDRAVLVRQVLRHAAPRIAEARSVELVVPAVDGWPTQAGWDEVGVEARPDGLSGTMRVRAWPWSPSWLISPPRSTQLDPDGIGVDGAAAGELLRQSFDGYPADPFVGMHFPGRDRYRSAGQQASIRAALTTPPGGTLLICLPTGEGKSFVFQVAAKVRFPGEYQKGLTLVVTPTVALAEDQERAALALGFGPGPLAYRGGELHRDQNKLLADRIKAGEQRLCFASPEAVAVPLRASLHRAAEQGRLSALVVDEAHLVESWGTDFRSSFQLLAGFRRRLLSASPVGRLPRTMLLSATLTGEAVSTLRTLFGGPSTEASEPFAVISAARLRPEIDYWVSDEVLAEEQRTRVFEALDHLPRPAILYTTEVKHAERWARWLRQRGYRRMECLTGKSSAASRRATIEAWSAGDLDLVVGTSAFGLGIDYAHVRTVIHACLPEGIDRFYQEVGRGGRDGKASVSLLIPTPRDVGIGESMSRKTLLTVERGFQRWQSMYDHPDSEHFGGHRHRLRLDVPPGFTEEYIDMVGDLSTAWNARLLTLLATAGLITLEGDDEPAAGVSPPDDELPATIEDDPNERRPVYQNIRVVDPRVVDGAAWGEFVGPRRAAQARGSDASIQRMKQHLARTACTRQTIGPAYEVDVTELVTYGQTTIRVARACGGCPGCRGQASEPAQRVVPERPPWPGRPLGHDALADLLDPTRALLVFYDHELPSRGSGARRRLEEALAALARAGAHNLIVLPGADLDPDAVQARAADVPIFAADSLFAFRSGLPTGTTVVVAPPGFKPTLPDLADRSPDDPRIFILESATPDPTRPDTPLRVTWPGPRLDLHDFPRELRS